MYTFPGQTRPCRNPPFSPTPRLDNEVISLTTQPFSPLVPFFPCGPIFAFANPPKTQPLPSSLRHSLNLLHLTFYFLFHPPLFFYGSPVFVFPPPLASFLFFNVFSGRNFSKPLRWLFPLDKFLSKITSFFSFLGSLFLLHQSRPVRVPPISSKNSFYVWRVQDHHPLSSFPQTFHAGRPFLSFLCFFGPRPSASLFLFTVRPVLRFLSYGKRRPAVFVFSFYSVHQLKKNPYLCLLFSL